VLVTGFVIDVGPLIPIDVTLGAATVVTLLPFKVPFVATTV
jgi:hypothetical protein